MSRLERVRQNLRKAYDTGRESVRMARAESDNGSEPDHEIEFELPVSEPEPDRFYECQDSTQPRERPRSSCTRQWQVTPR